MPRLNSEKFSRVSEAFLDFFFAPQCILCKNIAPDMRAPICDGCWSMLDEERYVGEITDRPIAPQLNRDTVRDILFAYRFYPEGLVQRLIHAFKYDGYSTLGLRMGAQLGELVNASSLQNRINVLVPMPIHSSRLRERRYNQSERIARGIATATGIPIESHAVKRLFRTNPQAKLNAQQRFDNIKNAFVADPRLVSGKRIAVVDDVITTGVTITECAFALHAAGASEIIAIIFAAAY